MRVEIQNLLSQFATVNTSTTNRKPNWIYSIPRRVPWGCFLFFFFLSLLEPRLYVNFLKGSKFWELPSFIQLAYIRFVYFYVRFLCRAAQRNGHEHHEMTISAASTFMWNCNVWNCSVIRRAEIRSLRVP